MEGHAFAMGTSGDFSAPELGLEGPNSISSEISSSRGDHEDGAEGTARAQNKRKVRTPWSDKNTEQLLRAYRKRKDENGRCIMRDPPYHPHHSVNGVEAWIETLLASPPHDPPVDLSESSHIFEDLEPLEHLEDL